MTGPPLLFRHEQVRVHAAASRQVHPRRCARRPVVVDEGDADVALMGNATSSWRHGVIVMTTSSARGVSVGSVVATHRELSSTNTPASVIPSRIGLRVAT